MPGISYSKDHLQAEAVFLARLHRKQTARPCCLKSWSIRINMETGSVALVAQIIQRDRSIIEANCIL